MQVSGSTQFLTEFLHANSWSIDLELSATSKGCDNYPQQQKISYTGFCVTESKSTAVKDVWHVAYEEVKM